MNSLNDLVLFSVFGKLFTYLWMAFPLPEWMDNSRFGQLHTCEKCSGTWIYSVLFLIFRIDLLHLLGLPYYPFAGEIITGGLVSFLVFLLSVGFKEQYMSFTIE